MIRMRSTLSSTYLDGAERRRRIDRHADLLAELADGLQRAVQMRSGFGMNGDAVAAGLGEGFEVSCRPARSSGGSRRWLTVQERSDLITSGPKEMFGTKWPSMTSRWIQSAPAAVTSRTSSPSLAKSAARIEGAMRMGSVIETYSVWAAIERGARIQGWRAAHCVGAAGGKKPLPRHSSRR